MIGSVEVDLSDYYTKSKVNALLRSKYNFVDFFEGMGDFNIDTDCNEETIYINVSSLGLGTFPPDFSSGGFLIQTRDYGDEDNVQTLHQ